MSKKQTIVLIVAVLLLVLVGTLYVIFFRASASTISGSTKVYNKGVAFGLRDKAGNGLGKVPVTITVYIEGEYGNNWYYLPVTFMKVSSASTGNLAVTESELLTSINQFPKRLGLTAGMADFQNKIRLTNALVYWEINNGRVLARGNDSTDKDAIPVIQNSNTSNPSVRNQNIQFAYRYTAGESLFNMIYLW